MTHRGQLCTALQRWAAGVRWALNSRLKNELCSARSTCTPRRSPAGAPLFQVDATRQAQWQKLTKLSPADMEALLNLEALGVPLQPKPKLGLTLTRRRNRAYRKVGSGCLLAPVTAAAAASRACLT